MVNDNIKISYSLEWDKYGTCYRQQVRLTRKQWDKAWKKINTMNITTSNNVDMYIKSELTTRKAKRGTVYYTNLTQRDYICSCLGIINNKRFRNFNTRFLVTEE